MSDLSLPNPMSMLRSWSREDVSSPERKQREENRPTLSEHIERTDAEIENDLRAAVETKQREKWTF